MSLLSAPAPSGSRSPSPDEVVSLPSTSSLDAVAGERVALPSNFQRAILGEIVAEDGLLVMSRGLGCRDIIAKALSLYCVPTSLVFVLNANNTESALLRLGISGQGVESLSLPANINADTPAQARKSIYSAGGVVFVTSRILVMDLLTQRISPAAITGFVLLNAHMLTDAGTEAFILRIYRRHTACGFVKAFSDDPITLASGFGKLERTLRTLMVRRVFLWPRFHLAIRKQLQKTEPEVVEVSEAMSTRMVAIQQGLLTCIKLCLQELKRSGVIDADDLPPDDASVFAKMDSVLRSSLSWGTGVDAVAKQLIADVRTLKKLLLYLPRYDCVTFYSFLEVLRAAAKDQKQSSMWMLTTAGSTVFSAAKERMYVIRNLSTADAPKFKGPVVTDTRPDSISTIHGLQVVLEGNPKWELLCDMLSEIEESLDCEAISQSSVKLHAAGEKPGAVALVLTRDDRTANLLQQYVTGDQALRLRQEFYRHVVKHAVRTQHLQTLVSRPATAAPQPITAASDAAPAKQSTGPSSVRVQPETRLLWQLAELMTNSSSFDGMDAFTAMPSGAGETVVPKRQSIQRILPVDVFTVDPDSVGLPSKPLVSADPVEEFRKVGGRPLKKSKSAPPKAAASSSAASNDTVCVVEDDVIVEEQDDDFVVMKPSKTASVLLSPPVLSSPPSQSQAPREPALSLEQWMTARRRIVIASQTAACGSGVPLLKQLKPNFIVLYDPEPELVQEIEVFRNYYAPDMPLRVYVLVHEGSADHMRYLHFLKSEKEAFEKLILLKSVILLPEQAPRGPGTVDSSDLVTDGWELADTRTRKRRSDGAGEGEDDYDGRVVVDMREFRSKLPSLLFQANLEICPVTLEVGDYVLSSDVCLERKSLSDLIGSLGSGRLFNQATSMSRCYKTPCLLIEFEGEKTMSLFGGSALPREAQVTHLASKLVILSLHFPLLRLLWSKDADATVKLVQAIKDKRDEPDAITASSMVADGETGECGVAALGPSTAALTASEAHDANLHDFLLKLPGISQFNVRRVLARVRTLAELADCSLGELEDMLGKASAKKFHTFIHAPFAR